VYWKVYRGDPEREKMKGGRGHSNGKERAAKI
jgi:hypothetical protein